MKYGLPYKGSKNKLAMRIVGLLPSRTHLYDVFCGGCAVTHAAMMGRKFKEFHINDINWMCPQFFKDVLEGKYDNDTRWISREDFFRLKDTDPYVAFVWSFGNNLRDYIYGKDVEPLKKAIHFAVFYADYSLAKALGHDLSFIDRITDLQQRYLSVKHYFERFGRMEMQSIEGGAESRIQIHAVGEPQQAITPCSLGGGQKRLQSFEAGNICRDVAKKSAVRARCSRGREARGASPVSGTAPQYAELGGGTESLITSALDFSKIEIKPDSVIYCDPPYRSTNVYDKEQAFDYDRFYDWCCEQKEPVFVSEYWMPEDRFEPIAEFAHRSTLSATANNAVTEKIFVPKHQKERGTVQLRLDFGEL